MSTLHDNERPLWRLSAQALHWSSDWACRPAGKTTGPRLPANGGGADGCQPRAEFASEPGTRT